MQTSELNLRPHSNVHLKNRTIRLELRSNLEEMKIKRLKMVQLREEMQQKLFALKQQMLEKQRKRLEITLTLSP